MENNIITVLDYKKPCVHDGADSNMLFLSASLVQVTLNLIARVDKKTVDCI